jgi:hypothetical protein
VFFSTIAACRGFAQSMERHMWPDVRAWIAKSA